MEIWVGPFWRWCVSSKCLSPLPQDTTLGEGGRKVLKSKVYFWCYALISNTVAVCFSFIQYMWLLPVLKSISCLGIKREYQIFHLSYGMLGISVCSTGASWSKILEGLKSCYLSCILTNKYIFCLGILCEGNCALRQKKKKGSFADFVVQYFL